MKFNIWFSIRVRFLISSSLVETPRAGQSAGEIGIGAGSEEGIAGSGGERGEGVDSKSLLTYQGSKKN
jgi:hypothetical protein